MKLHKRQADTLVLLGGGAVTLIGVIGLTTHHTYVHGYDIESYLKSNCYGIVVALLVVLICMLEVGGWDWDRGYLNVMLGGKLEETGRGELGCGEVGG